MTDREQSDAFEAAVDALIKRFVAEYNLTFCQAIGVLEMAAHSLKQRAYEDKYGEDEE